MPIISGTSLQKKEKIKAEINSEILANIQAYCEWANITDLGFFIEEAASFIFAKDKEWKQYKKAKKKRANLKQEA
ncbi:hypothetical protein [Legionella londiniensis]|uniref:Uncharacterized protein n=1 Tax=Legionella londiniensis TaxID=45068 RepID=A0A0W0VPE4_9GAMM|nr:hypothetical protein [Legionella londiniensis]KTD21912.1 hypothetical protein Llon_1077 [Legionella londiniensis]STX92605.1 Uncharacterised protein [Legionella londiniensis]